MARRKAHDSHENHERWLVSYADFITLLFAFFVVMFASTQADKSKAKEVSESVRAALEDGKLAAAISTMLGRGKHQASEPLREKPKIEGQEDIPLSAPAAETAAENLPNAKQKLESGLAEELKKGKVRIRLESRGLVVSLPEAAFFASGDDAVEPSSYDIVGKVAAVIKALPNPVRLEGHTDSRPIHTPRFRSNWDLSTARSIAMLQLLSGRFSVPAERMAVAGYAEHAPNDTNETEEGRAHNRRVDVVVLSDEAQKSEPKAVAATAQPAAKP